MNIILFGYRGSGKSSLGRKLADQLWKEFVDTDEEICRQFGNASIARIWQEYGEAAFREVESRVVRDVVGLKDHVISLGGGALMDDQSRENVKQADAKRIYLYCQVGELHRRITSDSQSQANRPDLTPMGGGIEEIQTVLVKRDPIYREVADHVFDVTHLDVEDGVRYLIKLCL